MLAFSTISHLGFLLLALSINSNISIYAFIFYLLQYSISNLNVFIILISIGYSFYSYVNNSDNEAKQLKEVEKNNSPIQLISQLKGYFNINPLLSLSLAITIFSFVGIPPLMGFFAKQMVLSAALDSGYVFLVLIAILTSVISAVYYLNIIKEVFFYKTDYKINSRSHHLAFNSKPLDQEALNSDFTCQSRDARGEARASGGGSVIKNGVYASGGTRTSRGNLGGIYNVKNVPCQAGAIHNVEVDEAGKKSFFLYKLKKNIILSSYLTITISILTLLILLFICFSINLLDLVNILSLSFL